MIVSEMTNNFKKFREKYISKKMNKFLRYLVYWRIVWYIIGRIRIALSRMLKYILGYQGTHEGVVLRESYTLCYITDCLRMQEIYNEIMCTMPNAFRRIPDRFKIQEICNKAVEVDPWQLKDLPNHFKTQEMCNKAARYYLFSLQFVPHWFVTQQQIDLWYDKNYVYSDNEMIKWYDGYKARMSQQAKIKDELLPIAWLPDRMMDWCMSEDEKSLWR